MKTFIIVIFLIITSQVFSANGLQLTIPDSSQIQILTLEDGSTLVGRIIEVNDDNLLYKTKYGTLTISILDIAELKLIKKDKIKKGKYWFPNPNCTRLFFAPTARMLKKGEGYFADYFIFLPTFTFGVTDIFTLGGGFSIMPGVDIDE